MYMFKIMTYENLILAFILYWVIVLILNKRGILERYNISTMGPILMVRTVKGQKLLDFLARPKQFWRLFADIGLPLMIIGMLAMFFLVLLTDYIMVSSILTQTMPEPGKYNSVRNIFLIPGVNEFIPLVWGTIALLVTLVVHELAHAILCKVEGIRVKSMGILLAPIPVGAFAEPDEEQLFDNLPGAKNSIDSDADDSLDRYGDRKIIGNIDLNLNLGTQSKYVAPTDVVAAITVTSPTPPIPKKVATRKERVRILTAGVMANFMTALIAFLLLFGPALGAIEPLSDVAVMGICLLYTSPSPRD